MPAETPAINPTPAAPVASTPASTEAPSIPNPSEAASAPVPPPVVTPPTTTPAPTPTPAPAKSDIISADDFLGKVASKTPEAPAPSKTPTPQPESRDTTLEGLGIPAESRRVFRDMSNDAFNYVVAQIKQATEHKKSVEKYQKEVEELRKAPPVNPNAPKELPKSWAEHPEAFVLHPEYPKHLTGYNNAMSEGQHWRNQLLKIERGEDWDDLDLDEKGKVVVKPNQKPSAEAKFAVQEWYNNARRAAQEHEQAIQNVRNTFTTNHQALRMSLTQRADKFFPTLATKEAREKNEYYVGMSKVLAAEGLENNVLSDMFSRMYSFLMDEIKLNNELKARLAPNAGTGAIHVNGNGLPSSDNLTAPGKPIAPGMTTVGELNKMFDAVVKGNPNV